MASGRFWACPRPIRAAEVSFNYDGCLFRRALPICPVIVVFSWYSLRNQRVHRKETQMEKSSRRSILKTAGGITLAPLAAQAAQASAFKAILVMPASLDLGSTTLFFHVHADK